MSINMTNGPLSSLLKAEMQTGLKAKNNNAAQATAASAVAASATATLKAYNPPAHQSPIAANQWAFVWGDPHIVEADGGKFDVQKEGKFRILKDKGINFTAEFQKRAQRPGEKIDPYNDKRPTVAKNANLLIDGKRIHIDASGKTTVDGKELGKLSPIELGPNSSIAKTVDGNILIQTSEYTLLFESVGEVGNKRLDFAIKSGSKGVAADGTNPTGLIGETFDSDNIKQNKPKNDIDSYLLNNKPSPDPNPSANMETEFQALLQKLIGMIQQLFGQMSTTI